jgi:hypothetical protein
VHGIPLLGHQRWRSSQQVTRKSFDKCKEENCNPNDSMSDLFAATGPPEGATQSAWNEWWVNLTRNPHLEKRCPWLHSRKVIELPTISPLLMCVCVCSGACRYEAAAQRKRNTAGGESVYAQWATQRHQQLNSTFHNEVTHYHASS